MKKSYIGIILIVILGLIPLLFGITTSYQTSMEDAVELAAPAAIEEAPAEIPLDDILLSSPEPSVQEEALAMTQASPSLEEELVVTVLENGDITAMFGAFNTAVMGWFTWFYRRREKMQETIKKLQLDMGDLGLMSLPELFHLILRSTISFKSLRRLMLRTNEQFSLYGFTHTSMLPKNQGRPIQHIDRTGRTVEWIIDDMEGDDSLGGWMLKERSLTGLIRAWNNERAKEIGFMQDHAKSRSVDYAAWFEEEEWRTAASYSYRPSDIIGELASTEIAIMLFFETADGKESVYTLIGVDTEMPETLEQWEDFIMAFRGANRSLLKDSILVTVVGIHLPVNKDA